MKKVLFLINTLGEGGAEKVLVTLVKYLDKSRYDVTVMTLFDVGVNKESLPEEIRYTTHYKRMPRGNSHIMKLMSPEALHRKFIKDKYDIEIAFLEGPVTRIISGCQDTETKLISWTHCTWHSESEFARSYRNVTEARESYRKFDKNIFVSQGVLEAFEKYCQVDNKDIVYNINDSDRILELAKEPVEDDVFDHDEFNIVSVGKVIPVKGYDRLARIHKKLLDDGYRVHTYILGIGRQKKEIEKYCADNNIQDTFTFLGYKQNPYNYMSRADLYVCSSLSEGMSTAVTEALITGTPVVTTDVSGMRELLGYNNEYGIITGNNEEDLTKAIEHFIESEDMKEKYTLLAVDRGKEFAKDKLIGQIDKLLCDI